MNNPLQLLTPSQLAIGSGVTFPIEIKSKKVKTWNPQEKKWADNTLQGWYPESGDVKLINHNLESLLLYQIGQKLRDEKFGNTLEACIEEPNTRALYFFIEYHIRQIITQYESRISFKKIEAHKLPVGVLIRLHYRVNIDNPLDAYMDFMVSNNNS